MSTKTKNNSIEMETDTGMNPINTNNISAMQDFKIESDDESSEDIFGIFDNYTTEDQTIMKKTMKIIHKGFKDNQQIQSLEHMNQIRCTIEIYCSTMISIVNNEQILYFIEFGKSNDMSVYDICKQIKEDGSLFLGSLMEMYDESLQAQETQETTDAVQKMNMDEDSGSDDEKWMNITSNAYGSTKRSKPGRNLDGTVRAGRLLLNEAMKDQETRKQWSKARQSAWKNRKDRPNAYYYRFNVCGQQQKNGQLTKDEHKLFMERVLELGVNYEWGTFAQAIPGRVGYQCSNYWRQLMKDGWVHDPNYTFVNKRMVHKTTGKQTTKRNLHFVRAPNCITTQYKKFSFTVVKDPSKVFRNLPAHHPCAPSVEEIDKILNASLVEERGTAKSKGNGSGSGKRKRVDDDDYQPKVRRKRSRKKRYKSSDDDEFITNVDIPVSVLSENPLPDFMDIMTGCIVVQPAISPYGHVLGYETWGNILRNPKTKDMCPFTKQKVSRRNLVKLNMDNIEEYRSKIINIDENVEAIAKLDTEEGEMFGDEGN